MVLSRAAALGYLCCCLFALWVKRCVLGLSLELALELYTSVMSEKEIDRTFEVARLFDDFYGTEILLQFCASHLQSY